MKKIILSIYIDTNTDAFLEKYIEIETDTSCSLWLDQDYQRQLSPFRYVVSWGRWETMQALMWSCEILYIPFGILFIICSVRILNGVCGIMWNHVMYFAFIIWWGDRCYSKRSDSFIDWSISRCFTLYNCWHVGIS